MMFGLGKVIKAETKTYLTDRKYAYVVAILVGTLITLYYTDVVKFLFLQFFSSHKTTTLYHAIFYYTLITLIPILSLIVVGNSISGMIERGEIRYYISKVSRESFFLGRLISHSLYLCSAILGVIIFLTAYITIKMHRAEIATGFAILLFLCIYATTFLSLYMLLSLIFKQFNAVAFILISASYVLSDKIYSVFYYVPREIETTILFQNSLYLLIFPIVFTLIALIALKVRDI